MRKEKEFKDVEPNDLKKKEEAMLQSTRRAIKRIIAIALLILGGYYLLVGAGIIPSRVIFGSYLPSNRELSLIAIIMMVIGLVLDDKWRAKIKNAFQ